MSVLILVHRTLGIAIGWLMLVWCASGAVMLFVPYPSMPEEARLAALAPIDWSRCCRFAANALPDNATFSSAEVEELNGVVVLRAFANGAPVMLDLSAGESRTRIGVEVAGAVSAAFARRAGPSSPAADASSIIGSDQWTVSGEFNSDRPLYKVALSDHKGTQLYVSSATGRIVQLTTAAGRAWNYAGAVPHWLYPVALRSHPALWSAVVIVTAALGCFLTLAGLALGWSRIRFSAGALSPYRGAKLWHHLSGSVAGILLLSWVASGLVSMNPGGFLEQKDDGAAVALQGSPRWGDIRTAFSALVARAPVNVVHVSVIPFGGAVYLQLIKTHGASERVDANGTIVTVRTSDLQRAATLLAATRPIHSQTLLTVPDSYYGQGDARLPVYRIILSDVAHTRYYVDPATAQLVKTVNANARWYRWLHDAPHRFDFITALQRETWRIALVLILLTGIACSAGSGVYLAARRIVRDMRSLIRHFNSKDHRAQ